LKVQWQQANDYKKLLQLLIWRAALALNAVAASLPRSIWPAETELKWLRTTNNVERTPCELLYHQRKKVKLVAHGIAEVPVQAETIHGVPIPEGYARVMVDRVEKG
jgi:hypothetical protein